MLFNNKVQNLSLSALALGMTSISTQVIILREFLNVFYGNELVIGSILAVWMLLTGTGVWIGNKIASSKSILPALFMFLGLLTVLTVMAVNLGRVLLFPAGTMVSLFDIFWFALVVLMPFCLVSGILFSHLCSIMVLESVFRPVNRTYYLESLGSFAGGILFNAVLIFFLSQNLILLLLIIVNTGIALIFSWQLKLKVLPVLCILTFLASVVFLLFLPFEKMVKDGFFKGQEVLLRRESPYGNIVVTETSGQKNFYENGVPLFPSNDPIEAEEAVHYALLQHEHPRSVLLISGGISGQIREILKYPVESIDYVEMNPAVIAIGEKFHLIPEDPRIHCISRDPRLYINREDRHYDAALIQLPEPGTAQINRYYTLEFFQRLKSRLYGNAVISISLRSTADYVDPVEGRMNSILYNTLKLVFKEVVVVPGMKNYFIASDSHLSLEVASLVGEKNISTQYVNPNYLDDMLISQRNAYIMKHIDRQAGINHDFRPIAYYGQLQLWLSQFNTKLLVPLIILLVLLLIYLIRLKPVSLGLFFTGFSASSLEFILIIAFQVMLGYVYFMTGILISVFMAGLAAGSYFGPSLFSKHDMKLFRNFQLSLALISLFAALILGLMLYFNVIPLFATIIFLLLSFLISALTGIQFSIGTSINSEKVKTVTTGLYSADLAGGAIGALVVSALLLPLLGINLLCLLLAGMNVICMVLMARS